MPDNPELLSILTFDKKQNPNPETAIDINGIDKTKVDNSVSNRLIVCKSKKIITLKLTKPLCILQIPASDTPEFTTSYFEVTIISGSLTDGVFVGVAQGSTVPNNKIPGTIKGSIAYNLDSGNVVYLNVNAAENEREKSFPYGGCGGTSTCIGCGVTNIGRVYFTRNGVLLPIVPGFRIVKVNEGISCFCFYC
jgi:hypothetical protein